MKFQLQTNLNEIIKHIPEYEGYISSFVKKIANFTIGESILYGLLMLLIFLLILNFVLNKFDYGKKGKQVILILFTILYSSGVTVMKYEANSKLELDSLRKQVLTHMFRFKTFDVPFSTLITNLSCHNASISKLPIEFPKTFNQHFDKELHLYMIDNDLRNLVTEKVTSDNMAFIEANQTKSITEIAEAIEQESSIQLDVDDINLVLKENQNYRMMNLSTGTEMASYSSPVSSEYKSARDSYFSDKVITDPSSAFWKDYLAKQTASAEKEIVTDVLIDEKVAASIEVYKGNKTSGY